VPPATAEGQLRRAVSGHEGSQPGEGSRPVMAAMAVAIRSRT